MNNIVSTIQNNTVSITLLNRGKANQIFDDVEKSGAKVVLRNNQPIGVLLSTEEYNTLLQMAEDYLDLKQAEDRMANYDPKTVITQEEIDREFGISDKDLEGYEEVEFE